MATQLDAIVINDDGYVALVNAGQPKEVLLPTFVQRSASYVLNPPYQRGNAWKTEFQQRLILSILRGRPIPAIYTCGDLHDASITYVIDGRQRIGSILRYYNGGFKIPVQIRGGVVEMSYRMLMVDPRFTKLKETWEEYKISIIPYMKANFIEQSQLFGEINTSLPLSIDELVFGECFYAKQLFELILNSEWAEKLLVHSSGQMLKKNERMKGSSWLARVLHVLFGECYNDVWAIRDLGLSNPNNVKKPRSDNLYSAIKRLDIQIRNSRSHVTAESLTWQDVESFQFYHRIEEVLKLFRVLVLILEYNGAKPVPLGKAQLTDVVIAFGKKIEDQQLTLAMMLDDRKLFATIIRDFIDIRGKTPGLTFNSGTPSRIKARIGLFDKVYLQHNGPVGIVNRQPTHLEQVLAALDAPAVCPIDGSAITRNNYALDHVDPKSKSSSTKFAVVGSEGNRIKSNLTKKNLEGIQNYIGEQDVVDLQDNDTTSEPTS